MSLQVTAPADPREAFFTQVEARFAQAASRGEVSQLLRIGPGELQLRFAGADLAKRMLPAFSHLAIDASGANGANDSRRAPTFRLSLAIFDGERSGVSLPRAPWTRGDYDVRGIIAGWNDLRWHTVIDPSRGGLRMLDRENRRAVCFFPSAEAALQQGFTTPLIGILAAFCRDLPLQIVHAGAVGSAAGGVLISGKGGAGKSTTVAACLDGGLDVAGDDLVLVELGAAPRIHSLLSTLKLEPSALARLPRLNRLAAGSEVLPREKHLLWASRAGRQALQRELPFSAILLPHVTMQPHSELHPISPAEALRSLAPSTLQLLPGSDSESFAKLARLVRRLPCYRLDAGTELDKLARLIAALCEKLGGRSP